MPFHLKPIRMYILSTKYVYTRYLRVLQNISYIFRAIQLGVVAKFGGRAFTRKLQTGPSGLILGFPFGISLYWLKNKMTCKSPVKLFLFLFSQIQGTTFGWPGTRTREFVSGYGHSSGMGFGLFFKANHR